MSFLDDLFKKKKGPDVGRQMRGDLNKSNKAIEDLKKKQAKFDMSKFDRLQSVGNLTAEELGRSELENIQLDPRLKAAQMNVLEQYKQGSQQGLSDLDLASMRQLRREEDARAAAQQKSISSDMAQRGAGGSGAELAARLMGQQSQAQNAAEAADRQAISSAQARQQALANMANTASGMESADWSRQSQVANAEDSRQKFNLGTRMDVQQRNLANQQRIADTNAEIGNQEQQYLNNMRQQKYTNRSGLTDKTMQLAGQRSQTRQYQPQEKNSMFDDALDYGSKGAAIVGSVYGMGAASSAMNLANAKLDAQKSKNAKSGVPGYAPTSNPYSSSDEVASQYQNWNKKEDGGVIYAKDGSCIDKYEDGGVEYMSDGSGDIIDSGKESYANDRVDAKVNDGEMVLNIAQQQRLMDLIKGKESANNIPDEPLVEGVPESYQKDLLNGKKNDKMTSGLKKLIEILGE